MVSLRRLAISGERDHRKGFSGGIVERIAPLTSLTSLWLPGNHVVGESTRASLEAAFSRFGSLKELTIERRFDSELGDGDDADLPLDRLEDIPGSCQCLTAIATCSSLRFLGTCIIPASSASLLCDLRRLDRCRKARRKARHGTYGRSFPVPGQISPFAMPMRSCLARSSRLSEEGVPTSES